jgi:hypothetical protein
VAQRQDADVKSALRYAAIVLAAITLANCGKGKPDVDGKPGADGLRDSFAQQLAANGFIKDFQRSGDDLTFSGPDATGREGKWRVHIDSAVVEPNANADQPYKGTVKSSWYSNGQLVTPHGSSSNLPPELMDNGLAQECWAMWDGAAKRWGWE